MSIFENYDNYKTKYWMFDVCYDSDCGLEIHIFSKKKSILYYEWLRETGKKLYTYSRIYKFDNPVDWFNEIDRVRKQMPTAKVEFIDY